jgi:flagellar hook protein FlgE
MSINSAMLAGVSGLVAQSAALAAVSDNIANVDTVGYKLANTNFETLVASQGVKGDYSAGGVNAQTTQLVTQQGNFTQTNSTTDLAINGQGFFVTTTIPTNVTPADPRYFTRAGAFTVDSQGYLRNSAGLYLQGAPVNAATNTVTINPSDVTQLTAINVESQSGASSPTTQIAINANVNSTTAVSAAAATYSASTPANNMASGAVTPDFTVQIPISDSLGAQHTLELDMLKDPAAPNTWYAELRALPDKNGTIPVVTGAPLVNGQIATGLLKFQANGQLDTANSTLLGNPPNISFGASSATAPAAGAVQWAQSLGLATQSLNIQLGQAPGGITQFASTSVTQSIVTNGTAFGNLTNVVIDSKGKVTATFDNGVSRLLAQVAIATFPNADGLKSQTGDAYSVTSDSGTPNLKAPGTGGAGQISPSSLESSTVDLSTQFTDLITTQRAYSASSKIITTADQMLQDLLNIIR